MKPFILRVAFGLAVAMCLVGLNPDVVAGAGLEELPPGGPFVDFTWSDDYGDVITKLTNLVGVKSVKVKFHDVDFSGAISKAEVYNRLKAQAKPSAFRTYVGIDRKVYMPLDGQIAAELTAFEDIPFRMTVTFEGSPGLVLRSRSKTLLTDDAEFYVPQILEKVQVAPAADDEAKRLVAKRYPMICNAFEKQYAAYLPQFGAIERNADSVKSFRLDIIYPKKNGAQLFATTNFRLDENNGQLIGGFSFSAKRDPTVKAELDQMYQKHAIDVQSKGAN